MTVAVHHWQKIYSFVAIVVLECLNIIFWAASLGTLASQFPVKYAIDGSHGNYSVVTVLVIVMIILAIIMLYVDPDLFYFTTDSNDTFVAWHMLRH